jgi:hypothetical protein
MALTLLNALDSNYRGARRENSLRAESHAR